ncbi:MAG: hypothetical protein WCS28_02005 [Thiomicrospira sp.]|jgi:hypothetical protein
MQVIKVMSIIGMVLFSLSLIAVVGFSESDVEASMGWGMIATIYGIALSITAFIQVKKANV